MALAPTSAAVLKTPFLGARRALANAAAKPAPRRALVVAAAAAAKKSWIPAIKSDAEIVNPPWLDGS
jgi:light-harvesting complex II chlorophyll a/b binding protein 6